MKTVVIYNATPVQLDWLAAKIEGYFRTAGQKPEYWESDAGVAHFVKMREYSNGEGPVPWTNYTAQYNEWGPLLEELVAAGWKLSVADFELGFKMQKYSINVETYYGQTIGTVVIRCHVASKYTCGTVDIPDTL